MKKGFTLAEVMLVLSIIGVLVALMIPVLDKTRPDETTLKYRKAFFAIEQGIRNILNDAKLYESGDLRAPGNSSTADEDGNCSEGQIKLNGVCYTQDTSGETLCHNLANTLNTIGAIKCPGDGGFITLNLGNGAVSGEAPAGADSAVSNTNDDTNLTENKVNFVLSNGVAVGGITGQWNVTNDNKTWAQRAFITLCVDVNGIGTGVDRGCATADRANPKRDQFRIRIARDGKIYTGSPTGPNNWYLETLMLINPGAITGDKRVWTEDESEELTKAAAVDNDTDLTNQNSCPVGYEWYEVGDGVGRCVFLGGFSLEKLKGSSSSK